MYSLIIGLFILAGFVAAIMNGRKIQQSKKTKNWPETTATLRHKAGRNEKDAPEIYINYQVADKKYNKQVQPSTGEETTPGFAEYFKKKYPDGENITVFYNPDSPEDTLFAVGVATEDKFIFGMAISSILLGFYALTV